MIAVVEPVRRDGLIIGLVGLAHLLSHFYQVALAPLFPLIKDEFGVSYTAMGLVLSVLYAVSGACQAFVGILVDRYGADRLMLGGVGVMASAVLLMGLAPAYWALLPLAVAAAIGNSVFHPADLSILSTKVSPERMGRAFAIHGFGGTCGYFLAPIVIFYGVASVAGWRAGLVVAGLIGWAALALLVYHRDALRMPDARTQGGEAMPSVAFYVRLLKNASLVAAFFYFVLIAAALIGVQSFSAPALVELYGAPLAVAAGGLTAFLGGSAAGMLAGGELADRVPRHAAIASGGLLLGAALMGCVATLELPVPVIVALLGLAGFCTGCTNPSRDILVRKATPPGASGKVFGFVYSGLDLGGALAPLLFGWLLDGGAFRSVFVAVAVMYLIAILSVMQLSRGR